jgi:hypothetical protein
MNPNMPKSTRRQFILRTATQAAGLRLVVNRKLINLPASLLPEPAGPNDRVNLRFIGFGTRGNIWLESDCGQALLHARSNGLWQTGFHRYSVSARARV